jgi:hypothetical protein
VIVELTVSWLRVVVDPKRVDTFSVLICPFKEIKDEVLIVELTVSRFRVVVDPNRVDTFSVET